MLGFWLNFGSDFGSLGETGVRFFRAEWIREGRLYAEEVGVLLFCF